MSPAFEVTLDATASQWAAEPKVSMHVAEASPMGTAVSRMFPPAIDHGQAYYWTYTWQAGERESRKELAEGKARVFENAQEAIRWLLSD